MWAWDEIRTNASLASCFESLTSSLSIKKHNQVTSVILPFISLTTIGRRLWISLVRLHFWLQENYLLEIWPMLVSYPSHNYLTDPHITDNRYLAHTHHFWFLPVEGWWGGVLFMLTTYSPFQCKFSFSLILSCSPAFHKLAEAHIGKQLNSRPFEQTRSVFF